MCIDFLLKYLSFCHILIIAEFAWNILENYFKNFMKTRPLAAGCFVRTQKLTTGQEEETKPIVNFCIFANAPKIFNELIPWLNKNFE